ncbi:MAG: hypothetical protein GY856_03860 [bacterium]|nr:hypothetical protein [bacterium]
MTCDSWIPVIRPHLSEVLVDRRALGRLRDLARQLPGDCLGAIEVRLAAASGTVDFSLRLAETAQARCLVDQVPAPHLRSFLSHWSEGVACLAPVPSVWLEFDLDHEPPFDGLRSDNGPRTAPSQRLRPTAAGSLPVPVLCAQLRDRFESDWLIDSLLPAMRGSPLSSSQRRLLRRCLDAVPASGRALYLFSLLPRPGNAVRLELFGLDPAAMADYLERVAGAGAAERIAALAPLIAECERPHLSFDVGSEISGRIGIEGSFARPPNREPRWAELLDRLVASGLCTPAKRDAVFAWPGYDSLSTAADRWPEEGVGLGGYCVRCLSHVKLVSWPDRGPEAKAYLLFQHLGKGAHGRGSGIPPSATPEQLSRVRRQS